jgi:hypothetical protein
MAKSLKRIDNSVKKFKLPKKDRSIETISIQSDSTGRYWKIINKQFSEVSKH